MSFISINPATKQEIAKHREISEQEAIQKIENSHQAWIQWKETSLESRAALFVKLAAQLEQKKEALARLATLEMGKPIRQARTEIDKCAWACRYFAHVAVGELKPAMIDTDLSRSYYCFEPLGVVLAIMPWNFPYWQVFRFAVPTLMAGNATVVKHAPTTMGCSEAIAALFKEVGFPAELLNHLPVSVNSINQIIEHPLVRGVTLTGSTRAGKAVAQKAGESLKKTVLELGGNDPYIILEDADLELASSVCVESRFQNTGQSCIAAKRWIVHESISQEFENLVLHKMQSLKVGDPINEDVDLGPLARADLRDQLHAQVEESVIKGAKKVIGGQFLHRPGFYYAPTLLTHVFPGMPAFDQEMFGPVASMIRFRTLQEALELANQSPYGLGGVIFSRDQEKAEKLARYSLEVGTACVNTLVKSDPRFPFGGIKNSGFGRELGPFGLKEFTNIKTIFVK